MGYGNEAAYKAFVAAARLFVWKCENGRARSTVTYAQLSDALDLHDGTDVDKDPETSELPTGDAADVKGGEVHTMKHDEAPEPTMRFPDPEAPEPTMGFPDLPPELVEEGKKLGVPEGILDALKGESEGEDSREAPETERCMGCGEDPADPDYDGLCAACYGASVDETLREDEILQTVSPLDPEPAKESESGEILDAPHDVDWRCTGCECSVEPPTGLTPLAAGTHTVNEPTPCCGQDRYFEKKPPAAPLRGMMM